MELLSQAAKFSRRLPPKPPRRSAAGISRVYLPPRLHLRVTNATHPTPAPRSSNVWRREDAEVFPGVLASRSPRRCLTFGGGERGKGF